MKKTPPPGSDVQRPVRELRSGDWIVHPTTGDWVNVNRGVSAVRKCFGPDAGTYWFIDIRGEEKRYPTEVPDGTLITVRLVDPKVG